MQNYKKIIPNEIKDKIQFIIHKIALIFAKCITFYYDVCSDYHITSDRNYCGVIFNYLKCNNKSTNTGG